MSQGGGHQLTLQRIRRSLEKLKRKSTKKSDVTREQEQVDTTGGKRESGTTRSKPTTLARPTGLVTDKPIPTPKTKSLSTTKSSASKTKEGHGAQKAVTSKHNNFVSIDHNSASVTAHKSSVVKSSTPKSHQYDVTNPSPIRIQQDGSRQQLQQVPSDRRHEFRTRRRVHQSAQSLDQIDPHDSQTTAFHGAVAPASQLKSYSTLNMTQLGGSDVRGATTDTECMIMYDGGSDGVARSALESHSCIDFNRNEARLTGFKNLEDSGIDLKSPPSSSRTRKSGSKKTSESTSRTAHAQAQGKAKTYHQFLAGLVPPPASSKPEPTSHLPTPVELNPAHLKDGDSPEMCAGLEANHVTRTGSFSSMRSLPVAVYQHTRVSDSPHARAGARNRRHDQHTPASVTSPMSVGSVHSAYTPAEQLSRQKSQSMTSLNHNKVSRRRSLPPLEVSQEKLEERKSVLSRRLAKKINTLRTVDRRYMLPSGTSANVYQSATSSSNSVKRHQRHHSEDNSSLAHASFVADVRSNHSFSSANLSEYKSGREEEEDNTSLADMEVACILEGKPEHPTDSDVEDYLACVESETKEISNDDDVTSQKKKFTSNVKKGESQSKVKKLQKENILSQNLNSQAAKNKVKVLTEKFGKATSSTKTREKPVKSNVVVNGKEKEVATRTSHDVSSSKIAKKSQKTFNKLADQSMQQFLTDCHLSTAVTSLAEKHFDALHQQQSSTGQDCKPPDDVTQAANKPNDDVLVQQLENEDTQNVFSAVETREKSSSHQHVPDVFDASEIPPPLTDLECIDPVISPVCNTSGVLESDSAAIDASTRHKSEIKLVLGAMTSNNNKSEAKTNTTTRAEQLRHKHSLVSPISPAKPSTSPSKDLASDKPGLPKVSTSIARTVPSPDIDMHKKSVTIFSLLTSHDLLPFSLHKTSQRSFGIAVKRESYSNDDVTSANHVMNVVVVLELAEKCPKCVTASLLPGDVILEVSCDVL